MAFPEGILAELIMVGTTMAAAAKVVMRK